MATAKKTSRTKAKKSRVQVRDMKPRKDAKGGRTSKFSTQSKSSLQ